MAVENSKVLIIVNNWGIEETELTRPLRDLKAAGAKVTLAATTLDPCETVQHDRYEGETLTPDARLSAPCRYIAADIENAGGHYVDEQLHVDDANGFKLITSRKPDDLDYFVGAIKDALK